MPCCNTLKEKLEWSCNQHDDPFDCPDAIIRYSPKFDEYGIIVHDGGSSVLQINYCPWCGKRLPESKRDLWFETLEKMGYQDPGTEEIPEEFETGAWYKK